MTGRLRVGIVGLGRIGTRLRDLLAQDAAGPLEVGAPARDVGALLALRPDIVVECASPAALADIGPHILAAGIDLAPLSLTAFCDPQTERRLLAAGPGRLEIPPGALGALENLHAARLGGLKRVVYRQIKSPAMWARTPAAALADLAAIAERRVFFEGSVRAVARLFPHNLNVAVGAALAGLGLDRTELQLIADPATDATQHELDFDAEPGAYRVRIDGRKVGPGGDPVDYSTFSLLALLQRRNARSKTA